MKPKPYAKSKTNRRLPDKLLVASSGLNPPKPRSISKYQPSFPFMAFTLSSPILPHKLSFSFSDAPKRAFLSSQFTFPLNRNEAARFGHFKIHCKCTNINDTREPVYPQDLPTKLFISTFQHGMKTVKTLIATILIFVQISTPLRFVGWDFWSVSPANAVLYSPDTKVPRTGELALRRAIPANANMKAIQASLEDISFLLRIPQRKPYVTMEGNVKKALKPNDC